MPGGYIIGGAVAYAGAVANAAGCRTAIVTNSAPEENWQLHLPGIEIHQLISEETTVFENIYVPGGRIQTIHSHAGRIEGKDIPAPWQRASIVHLAPIADEVDPHMIERFSNSIIGLAPQGWMRNWEKNGRIFLTRWLEAEYAIPKAAVVFISEEDLVDGNTLADFRRWSRVLVLTQGADGCTIFMGDEERQFLVDDEPVVDTTGAGDIFAAAFLIRFQQTAGNPFEAARFANKLASLSVTVSGLQAKIEVLNRRGFC
ncbi:MAG: PfkB family carbohydrate kinase [Candidatus Promineifilaceae bacterium]|nr:PfkB family carbohydrate kinase [Candidatus Promineifilaceae bacterium]